jgi:plastocyanin
VRYRCILIGVLAAILVEAPPALANNQTVTVSSNVFTSNAVTVFKGETVTWNNTGGTHNVHFDDNSYIMPNPASSSLWTRSRTFNTPGTFRYYCDLHGDPGGIGMAGTVTVTAPTGFARPKGATPLRATLAPAYKPCTTTNRAHGGGLSYASCNPPAQVSDFATVGSPDANAAGANSVGAVTLRVLSPTDVSVIGSITDVRKKSDLTDYTGELALRLPLQITDKLNGPAANENGTGNTAISFPIPCATTSDTTVGSTCSITTSANAVFPGAAVANSRAVWESQGVQVFDGGPDALASTTTGNTLFANQAIFVP